MTNSFPDTPGFSDSRTPPIGELTNFLPTDKQRQFLELVQAQRDPVSIRHLCATGVVSRTTLYKWQRRPAFRAWLGYHAASALHANFALTWMLASQAAVEGHQKMIELMLKYSAHPKGIAALSAYLSPFNPTGSIYDDRPSPPAAWTEESPQAIPPGNESPQAIPPINASPQAIPPSNDSPQAIPPGNESPPAIPPIDAPGAAPRPSSATPYPPPPTPSVLPTGAIAAAYRVLSALEGEIAEPDLAAAKRADQFAQHLENLRRHAERETQERERALGPPALFAAGLDPAHSEVESLSLLRWDDFARRLDRPGGQLAITEHCQLRAECRADLIAAKAGHLCRAADALPAAVPEDYLDEFEEDCAPVACAHPDPAPGAGGLDHPPTCLQFLDAFRTGDLETAKRGLRAGLPIHLRSVNNLTPFSIAARNGQIEMYEFAWRAARSPLEQALAFDHPPLRPAAIRGSPRVTC